MKSSIAFVLLALVAPDLRAQQNTTPATVTVNGVVVTANDAPLPRVRVAVASAPLSPSMASLAASLPPEAGVLTDTRGRFTIRVPAAASVRLAFTKARYTSYTVQMSPNALAAQGSEIHVRMALAGAISGQVRDRSGNPLMSATVTLRPDRTDRPDAPVPAARTNDLGEYRFGGLVEGRYVVTAEPSMFALGADIADRQALVAAAAVRSATINVSAGSEIAGIDLTIDAPSELDRDRTIGSEPGATGSVSGRVVGVDGLPIGRAVVHAYRPYIAGRQVETDDNGRYRIGGLGPGDYTIEARKYGFDTRQYGQDGGTTGGRPVAVQNGQALESIDVTLTRGGAIAGTIVDEFGEPMQDVTVAALEVQVVAGRTRVLRASTTGNLRTDDHGKYRLSGLQPGTYIVQATVRDTLLAASGYLPVFHPGTLTPDQATPVTVAFSTTVAGVDFALVPTPAQRVTGIVLDASGRPARGEVLLAVSHRSGAIQTETVRADVGADGSFVFPNVPPGDYVVQANGVVATRGADGRVARTEPQFGMSFVTVSAGDPPPVELSMSAGATVSGRVRYEGLPPGPSPLLTLAARSADRDRGPLRGYGPGVQVRTDDNSFVIRGVFGPMVLLAEPQRNDWYLKSVLFKGQDVTDTPLDVRGGTVSEIEVVISALGATATGRVTDDRAAPVEAGTVLVFPTFPDRWFDGSRWVKTARTSADGTFIVTGLPPGNYWVAAVERPRRRGDRGDAAVDPALLESLSSRAIRITLGEGESQDVGLRLVRF